MQLRPSGLQTRVFIRNLRLAPSRSLSTTPVTLSNYVPPESPSYIRLPTTPQSEDRKPTRVRGYLPVPRDVFSRQGGHLKAQPQYIDQTAPQRTKKANPASEVQQWKTEMANARRTNLRSGLRALWGRRTWNDEVRNSRLQRKLVEYREAARAPQRQDDQVTRGTVLSAVLDTKVYADPERFTRADRSRTKVINLENSKREARRDALVELYMSASNFIVNESELQAEIEKTFSKDFFIKQSQAVGRYGITENTWGVYGKPLSVAQMLAYTTGASTKTIHFDETEHDRSVKRQKSVAEELTGGKME